jgi:four helix bundle protein
MRNHEELEVWRKAHALTLQLYQLTNGFAKSEMFGLTSQMRRAAVSVEANLAEGCGRWSDPELARFVRIAMGSASELQCHLLLARELGSLATRNIQGPWPGSVVYGRCLLRFLEQSIGLGSRTAKPLILKRIAKGE